MSAYKTPKKKTCFLFAFCLVSLSLFRSTINMFPENKFYEYSRKENFMNIKDIQLNSQQICGNTTGTGLLLSVSDGYEYVNGKATDTITHIKNTVVFTDNQYEKMIVKVKGNKPLLTNEQIQQKGGSVKVAFKNLTGRFYRTNTGEYALSASADSMEVQS